MKHNFYSVRIIRKEEQVALAVYLKEFFVFCGIYVREYIPDVQEQDEQTVDLNLFLFEMKGTEKKPEAFLEYLLEHQGGSPAIESGRKEINKKLEKMSEIVDDSMEREGRLEEVLKCLLNIFHEYDYAHLNYTKHCFLNQLDADEKLNMAQTYYKCYVTLKNKIRDLDAEWEEIGYLKFARFNCARKVDDVCLARGDLPYFEEEKIMKSAAEISDLMPGFSMGYVLAGQIGLNYDYLWRDGKVYLERAMKMEKENRHGAFIYYILGHSLEIEMRDFEAAWEQYQKILVRFPEYHRGIFKHGCRMIRNQRGLEAYELFYQVWEMMKRRERSGIIQPQEIEYKYKCERILAESSMVNKYCKETREYLHKEAQRDLTETLAGSRFLEEFCIKKDYENYKKYLEEKLRSHHLNSIVYP